MVKATDEFSPLTCTIKKPAGQILPSFFPRESNICVGDCDLFTNFDGSQRSDPDVCAFQNVERVWVAGMVHHGCKGVQSHAHCFALHASVCHMVQVYLYISHVMIGANRQRYSIELTRQYSSLMFPSLPPMPVHSKAAEVASDMVRPSSGSLRL